MELLQNLDLGTILTIVLGGIATFAGGFWLKGKGKLKEIANLVLEVYELLSEIERALDDDKVSKQEIEAIKQRIADVKEAFKKIITKG